MSSESKAPSRWFESLAAHYTRKIRKAALKPQGELSTPPVLAQNVGPVNTKGLPTLPTELLIEIASYLFYLPSIPVPCEILRTVYSRDYLPRIRTLRSLSQTCQSLRRLVLPILWDRIEACASEKITQEIEDPDDDWMTGVSPKIWRKDLTMDLMQQLETVTVHDPSLARHVKVVSVVITQFRTRATLKKLLHCLSLLPNVHTVQFLGTGKGLEESDFSPFKKYTFPSVKTLVLGYHVLWSIRSFPNTTALTAIPDPWANAELVRKAAKHLKHLQEFRVLPHINFGSFMYGNFWEELAESFPKLQVLTFDTENTSLTLDMIRSISSLPDLRKAVFTVQELPKNGKPFEDWRVQALVSEGVAALKELPKLGEGLKRRVIVEDPLKLQLVPIEH